jgi:hypothetical protein
MWQPLRRRTLASGVEGSRSGVGVAVGTGVGVAVGTGVDVAVGPGAGAVAVLHGHGRLSQFVFSSARPPLAGGHLANNDMWLPEPPGKHERGTKKT